MTDFERAVAQLPGHSLCLCRGEELLTEDGRGIYPMLRLIGEGRDLEGFSCADVIVGKAAAMLFVKAGIRAVYGAVMSESGRRYLEEHGIPCIYGELTDRIINRQGTDICPMERTVSGLHDPEEGCRALIEALAAMQKK
ncbi:MAG: DUF1893 domain-containing protein [Oscillospiraceae bacterium]|nr:DUF1893 domain-containing protein [Oscillospiraceae bacterium]